MTTVFSRNVTSGPRMHVLVVGVGRYPYCGPATDDEFTSRLRDLPGAAVTAAAVAGWFVADQAGDIAVPLASVEVAISADSPVIVESKKVIRATRDGFEECFQRWYERCDDPDSVAVFYFCGHGCARDVTQQMLLLEDFGKGHNAFAHSVNFSATHTAMISCQARTQCYFIDACREIPLELEQSTRFEGITPAPGGSPAGRTTDLVVHAAEFGQPAYAPLVEPTRFAVAVRQAFAGGAARKSMDGVWRVTADQLGSAVQKLIKLSSKSSKHQAAQPSGGADETVLRVLSKNPLVPFDLTCRPQEAHCDAVLRLATKRDGVTATESFGPMVESWTGKVQAGVYGVRLDFPANTWWHDDVDDCWVLPPVLVDQLMASRL